jgi:hypothetical protein
VGVWNCPFSGVLNRTQHFRILWWQSGEVPALLSPLPKLVCNMAKTVAGQSTQRPTFNAWIVHVGFVAEKWHWDRFFCKCFGFRQSLSFYQCPTDTVWSLLLTALLNNPPPPPTELTHTPNGVLFRQPDSGRSAESVIAHMICHQLNLLQLRYWYFYEFLMNY